MNTSKQGEGAKQTVTVNAKIAELYSCGWAAESKQDYRGSADCHSWRVPPPPCHHHQPITTLSVRISEQTGYPLRVCEVTWVSDPR